MQAPGGFEEIPAEDLNPADGLPVIGIISKSVQLLIRIISLLNTLVACRVNNNYDIICL